MTAFWRISNWKHAIYAQTVRLVPESLEPDFMKILYRIDYYLEMKGTETGT